MVIYLDCPLPDSSSGMFPDRNATYPKTRRAAVWSSIWSCFRWGLHSAFRYRKTGGLLHRHSTLTRMTRAVSFLLHFPGSHLHRTLSGILPYEARTFLSFRRDHPCCCKYILNQCFLCNITIVQHSFSIETHPHLKRIFHYLGYTMMWERILFSYTGNTLPPINSRTMEL